MWPTWNMSLAYWRWHSYTQSFLPYSVITAGAGFQRHGKEFALSWLGLSFFLG